MMYVRQARPLGYRGWSGWLGGGRGVDGRREGGTDGGRGGGGRDRRGGGALAYTLRIIYWHWIYLKLCYAEALRPVVPL